MPEPKRVPELMNRLLRRSLHQKPVVWWLAIESWIEAPYRHDAYISGELCLTEHEVERGRVEIHIRNGEHFVAPSRSRLALDVFEQDIGAVLLADRVIRVCWHLESIGYLAAFNQFPISAHEVWHQIP